jgi:hypothetical protein
VKDNQGVIILKVDGCQDTSGFQDISTCGKLTTFRWEKSSVLKIQLQEMNVQIQHTYLGDTSEMEIPLL